MRYLSISGFPIIEPEEADSEVIQQFDIVQQEVGLPVIPNWAKALAVSPGALTIYVEMLKALNRHITLPQSLVPMILYSVANARNCTYCKTSNELFCRTLGVDEETLEKVSKNLGDVSPKRLQAILRFALQCAFSAQELTTADYDRVREQGVSDDELAQIIFLAALGNLNDTIADSFKIEVESVVLEGLGR